MPFDPSAETCLFGDVGTFGSVLDWLTQKGELSPRWHHRWSQVKFVHPDYISEASQQNSATAVTQTT